MPRCKVHGPIRRYKAQYCPICGEHLQPSRLVALLSQIVVRPYRAWLKGAEAKKQAQRLREERRQQELSEAIRSLPDEWCKVYLMLAKMPDFTPDLRSSGSRRYDALETWLKGKSGLKELDALQQSLFLDLFYDQFKTKVISLLSDKSRT